MSNLSIKGIFVFKMVFVEKVFKNVFVGESGEFRFFFWLVVRIGD